MLKWCLSYIKPLVSAHTKLETELPNPPKNLPHEKLLSVGFETNCKNVKSIISISLWGMSSRKIEIYWPNLIKNLCIVDRWNWKNQYLDLINLIPFEQISLCKKSFEVWQPIKPSMEPSCPWGQTFIPLHHKELG